MCTLHLQGVFTLVPPSTFFDADGNFFDTDSRFVFTLRVLMMSTASTAKVKMMSNFCTYCRFNVYFHDAISTFCQDLLSEEQLQVPSG